MKKLNKKGGLPAQAGFTLIEILVVIGIIAVLAAIVIIAINPARQFAQARDTQRVSNVNAISNAVGQKIADCKGVFGATLAQCPSSPQCPALPPATADKQVGVIRNITGTGIALGTLVAPGTIDLGCLAPTYMAALPFDPSTTSTTVTDYNLIIETSTDGGRITVAADGEVPVGTNNIKVTR